MAAFLRYKKIILYAGIAILAFVAYSIFFKGDDAPQSVSPLTVELTAGQDVGGDLVALLLKLQVLQLNTAALQNPVFRSLRDFGQDIPLEPVGRPNPFAPL